MELKSELKKRHVVSFFTTPDSLAAKVLVDVPRELAAIGVEVEGKITTEVDADIAAFLSRFRLLPKLHRGKEFILEFKVSGSFSASNGHECDALDLPLGASVDVSVKVPGDHHMRVYAQDDHALRLVALRKGAVVKVRVATAFRTYSDMSSGLEEEGAHEGLVVREILDIRGAS